MHPMRMNLRCYESGKAGLSRALTATLVLLIAAAIAEQLRKPASERTWRGRLFDFVPYDFRVPTMEVVRDALWNPNNPNLLTGKVFGVGWTVNFYPIWRAIRSAVQSR